MSNIEFNNPEFLWLLIMVPLMAYFFYKSRHFRVNTFKMSSISDFGSGIKATIYPLFDILKLITIGLIIVGLARPQEISNSVRTKTSSGIDIVIAVDISSSMFCLLYTSDAADED